MTMVDPGNQTVAILGYGTAGVNAAIALRGAGFDGVIRVFSDTDILPTARFSRRTMQAG